MRPFFFCVCMFSSSHRLCRNKCVACCFFFVSARFTISSPTSNTSGTETKTQPTYSPSGRYSERCGFRSLSARAPNNKLYECLAERRRMCPIGLHAVAEYSHRGPTYDLVCVCVCIFLAICSEMCTQRYAILYASLI